MGRFISNEEEIIENLKTYFGKLLHSDDNLLEENTEWGVEKTGDSN